MSDHFDFELTEKLDFTQPINKVKYSCRDCENSWVNSEFMDEFYENDYSDGWGLGGEYGKIMRSIVENMFRAPGTSIGIVCPHCCAEHERKSGNIEVEITNQTEEREELEYIAEYYSHAIEEALGKISTSGLEMNEKGRLRRK